MWVFLRYDENVLIAIVELCNHNIFRTIETKPVPLLGEEEEEEYFPEDELKDWNHLSYVHMALNETVIAMR